ncbi:MAG: hypothetical protein KDA87_16170 [Planctomycetales bacterium]|nr:hypothetical protein [Planctomycetales bacterium]
MRVLIFCLIMLTASATLDTRSQTLPNASSAEELHSTDLAARWYRRARRGRAFRRRSVAANWQQPSVDTLSAWGCTQLPA